MKNIALVSAALAWWLKPNYCEPPLFILVLFVFRYISALLADCSKLCQTFVILEIVTSYSSLLQIISLLWELTSICQSVSIKRMIETIWCSLSIDFAYWEDIFSSYSNWFILWCVIQISDQSRLKWERLHNLNAWMPKELQEVALFVLNVTLCNISRNSTWTTTRAFRVFGCGDLL